MTALSGISILTSGALLSEALNLLILLSLCSVRFVIRQALPFGTGRKLLTFCSLFVEVTVTTMSKSTLFATPKADFEETRQALQGLEMFRLNDLSMGSCRLELRTFSVSTREMPLRASRQLRRRRGNPQRLPDAAVDEKPYGSSRDARDV